MSHQIFLNTPGTYTSTVPKAYLNWVLFYETQFKLVAGNYGAVQIPAMQSTGQKKILQAMPAVVLRLVRMAIFMYV